MTTFRDKLSLVAIALAAVALPLTLAACGDDEEEITPGQEQTADDNENPGGEEPGGEEPGGEEPDGEEPTPGERTTSADIGRFVDDQNANCLLVKVAERLHGQVKNAEAEDITYSYTYADVSVLKDKGFRPLQRIDITYTTGTTTGVTSFDFSDPKRVVCTNDGTSSRMGTEDAVYELTYNEDGLIASVAAANADKNNTFTGTFTYNDQQRLTRADITARGVAVGHHYTFNLSWGSSGMLFFARETDVAAGGLLTTHRTFKQNTNTWYSVPGGMWTMHALLPFHVRMEPATIAASFDWFKAFAYIGLFGKGATSDIDGWTIDYQSIDWSGQEDVASWPASSGSRLSEASTKNPGFGTHYGPGNRLMGEGRFTADVRYYRNDPSVNIQPIYTYSYIFETDK